VVERLSFQQQRLVQERGLKSLQQLDFAALVRVLDQNWHELSSAQGLPREGRTWVRELQTVRNKWAHLSAEAMPESELYRDADTLGRLMAAIGVAQPLLDEIDAVKAAALVAMADKRQGPLPGRWSRRPPMRMPEIQAPRRCSRSAILWRCDLRR